MIYPGNDMIQAVKIFKNKVETGKTKFETLVCSRKTVLYSFSKTFFINAGIWNDDYNTWTKQRQMADPRLNPTPIKIVIIDDAISFS